MWIRNLTQGHDDFPISAIDEYGSLIISGSSNGRITVWDLISLKAIKLKITIKKKVENIIFVN